MAQLSELQDFAHRRLKDYTERCHILKVYATTTPAKFVVVIGSEADAQAIPPIIWRQMRGYVVDVQTAGTGIKVPIDENTFVCYQNGRWVK